MYGKAVSQSELLTDDKTAPHHYFQLPCEFDWIHGGAIPGFKTILQYLREKRIERIVTLTVEPLKVGRNINHQFEDFYSAQWLDSDLEENDLQEFERIHIPITDGCFPNEENAKKLIEVAKSAQQDGKHVYFHCWAGRGRTCTSIIHILMNVYGKKFEEAEKVLKTTIPEAFDLKPAQISFLKRDEHWDKYLPRFYNPKVLTPANEICYTAPSLPFDYEPPGSTAVPLKKRDKRKRDEEKEEKDDDDNIDEGNKVKK